MERLIDVKQTPWAARESTKHETNGSLFVEPWGTQLVCYILGTKRLVYA